jgi:hypothetical protein
MAKARLYRIPFIKRLALSCTIAMGMSMFAGCVMDSPGNARTAPTGASVSDAAAESAAAGKIQTNPAIPDGCSREWSSTAMDWVLNCPDIRPSKPD